MARAEDCGVSADEDIVADGWMAFALVFAGAAEGNVVEDHAVRADFGGFTDDDTYAVIDEEAFADLGAWMDFDASEETGDLGDEAGYETQADFVEGMSEVFVENDGVKAWVKDCFKSAGGGVVSIDGFDFGEHKSFILFVRRSKR